MSFRSNGFVMLKHINFQYTENWLGDLWGFQEEFGFMSTGATDGWSKEQEPNSLPLRHQLKRGCWSVIDWSDVTSRNLPVFERQL